MKSDFLLLPLLLLAWIALSVRAQSATSLTIVVRNLLDGGSTANGQSVACVGTLNGWNNSAATAVASAGSRWSAPSCHTPLFIRSLSEMMRSTASSTRAANALSF